MNSVSRYFREMRRLVLTRELLAVDRLSTSAVPFSEVTTLEHELQRWRPCQTYLVCRGTHSVLEPSRGSNEWKASCRLSLIGERGPPPPPGGRGRKLPTSGMTR